MSIFAVLAALVVALAGTTSAEAKRYEGSGWERSGAYGSTYRKKKYAARTYRSTRRTSGVGGRPAKWCGWWMRTQLGGGPEYNLAWNWSRRGSRLSGPQVGAVVVWRHHVGVITGRSSDGRWIVKSGNDSGRVRERARSVSGAVFRAV